MSSRSFVVERLNWQPASEEYGSRKKWAWMPGAARVACFADAASAEADCSRRESERRGEVNPFTCGGSMHERSSLDEPRLCDWLLDAGLEPPEPDEYGHANWSDWWEGARPTKEQERAVWEIFDKVAFYEVVEVELAAAEGEP